MTKEETLIEIKTVLGDRVEELLKLYPKTFDEIKVNFYKKHENIRDYFNSYTFWKAFYNKVYDENIPMISQSDDFKLITSISFILRKEHLFNWTRNSMYEVNNCRELWLFFVNIVSGDSIRINPIKIETLKIWLLYYNTLREDDNEPIDYTKKIYIDDYMLKHLPELRMFIIGEVNG